MNLLIPSIFLAAIIYIIAKMYKERQIVKRAENIKAIKESEQRFIIEKIVMREIKERAAYWDNFNIGKYVEYLEQK